MEFRFTTDPSTHEVQAAKVKAALAIFANDPTLRCLTFHSYNNGFVRFCANTSADRPPNTPFSWVELRFRGPSYDTLHSIRITLTRAVDIERTERGAGNPLIHHAELTKFVQVLHDRWLKER